MPDAFERLMGVSKNIYMAASGAFAAGKFYRCEILALGAVGMTSFLRDDNETSEDMKVRAETLRKACRDLAFQARAAFMELRQKPSLSGTSRLSVKGLHELDGAIFEMDEIIYETLGYP